MKRSPLFGLLPALLFVNSHLPAEPAPESAAKPKTSEVPKGMTMRITQEIALGDVSCTADYTAQFLPTREHTGAGGE